MTRQYTPAENTPRTPQPHTNHTSTFASMLAIPPSQGEVEPSTAPFNTTKHMLIFVATAAVVEVDQLLVKLETNLESAQLSSQRPSPPLGCLWPMSASC